MKKKDIRDSKGEPLNDGDLVELKSGGVKMIINEIYFCPTDKIWKIACAWQDELKIPQNAWYTPTSLIKLYVS